jgi:hypothetical protein
MTVDLGGRPTRNPITGHDITQWSGFLGGKLWTASHAPSAIWCCEALAGTLKAAQTPPSDRVRMYPPSLPPMRTLFGSLSRLLWRSAARERQLARAQHDRDALNLIVGALAESGSGLLLVFEQGSTS